MAAEQDPAAVSWEVFIEWSGRKALSPLSIRALSAREARFRERASDWADITPDGCVDLDDFGAIIFVLLVLALLVLLAPVLIVVLLAAVEVTIVVGIALAALLARTLLGRPWRVVAINPRGEMWSWKQVGWQRSRELIERIEAELAAGADPAMLAPGDASPQGVELLPAATPTHLVENAAIRVAAKVVSIAVIAWAVLRLLLRLG